MINTILIPLTWTLLQGSETIYAQPTIIYVLLYTTQNHNHKYIKSEYKAHTDI
jgi:hypothetical protein